MIFKINTYKILLFKIILSFLEGHAIYEIIKTNINQIYITIYIFFNLKGIVIIMIIYKLDS